MSWRLMGMIFSAEIKDLKDGAGNVTRASTAKMVLLCLANHVNDEGTGAYPGLTRMQGLTHLSRPTIVNAYDALKFNGYITLVRKTRYNTNEYRINLEALVTAPEQGASTPEVEGASTPEDEGGFNPRR